jgi:hypothetical protein
MMGTLRNETSFGLLRVFSHFHVTFVPSSLASADEIKVSAKVLPQIFLNVAISFGSLPLQISPHVYRLTVRCERRIHLLVQYKS